MARRRLPPSKSLARTHGQHDLPPSLIIVCEGNTEKQLLDGLRGRWRIPSAKIELVGEAGVPSTVVTRAKELHDAHRSRFGRSSPVDVWVVFDRDAHPCWREAIQRARDLKFQLAISNPCIELWAILLHREHSAHVERDVVQRHLSQLHPDYHHDKNPYLDLDVVEKNLARAHSRATELQRRAMEAGDPLYNPTTCFSALIERLQSLCASPCTAPSPDEASVAGPLAPALPARTARRKRS